MIRENKDKSGNPDVDGRIKFRSKIIREITQPTPTPLGEKQLKPEEVFFELFHFLP